jgi:hypothetical protein
VAFSIRTAVMGAAALVAVTAGSATAAPGNAVQPQTVTGTVISGGADGTPRTLMCPPEENALGGGFSVSAPPGSTLSHVPADVLQSRPTPDATGWIIAVRKDLASRRSAHGGAPADLTPYVVCTQGENTPNG